MDSQDSLLLYMFVTFCIALALFFIVYFAARLIRFLHEIEERKLIRDQDRAIRELEEFAAQRQQEIIDRKKESDE